MNQRIEKQIGNHVVIHDNDQSGAILAWRFFHPHTEVPMLIKHIDDYDRWVFALEGTKAFQKALWSYAPWSFHQWKGAFLDDPADRTGLSDIGIFDLRKDGEAILRAHDQNVQSVVKSATRKCEINFDTVEDAVTNANLVWNNGGYYMLPGLAANCPPHLQSDVGHELANQSGTYGLLWHINKDGKCLCSLRSNDDYDVSAIAKAFGGGGHKNAAGFETDIATLLSWFI